MHTSASFLFFFFFLDLPFALEQVLLDLAAGVRSETGPAVIANALDTSNRGYQRWKKRDRI